MVEPYVQARTFLICKLIGNCTSLDTMFAEDMIFVRVRVIIIELDNWVFN